MVTKPETPVLKIEAEITQIRQSEYFHAWRCQLWHKDCLLPRSLLPDPSLRLFQQTLSNHNALLGVWQKSYSL